MIDINRRSHFSGSLNSLIIMKVVSSSTLGFPRMGPRRELKFALEKFWKAESKASEKELLDTAFTVEQKAWTLQASKVDKVTVGDYYLFDGVLTWTEYLGIIPNRFQDLEPGLNRFFAMARGADGATALSK
jgi:5-methyltetrahydropteroyltriglutamate--homocysteine methyltransferase